MNGPTYIDSKANTPETIINDLLHDLHVARERGESIGVVIVTIRASDDERRYHVAFTPLPTEQILWASHEIVRQIDKLNSVVLPSPPCR